MTPSPCETSVGMAVEPDVVCFSHLRWDFVHQRPQHLMTRCAAERRVLFVEEPIVAEGAPRMVVMARDSGVLVAQPHVPAGLTPAAIKSVQRALLDQLLEARGIQRPILWYETPMALPWSRHLAGSATVYDCMDELSAFKGAPAEMHKLESELMRRADVVFTGGLSLYEAKRELHGNIHAVPSSVDREHFGSARTIGQAGEPDDQRPIARPRVGFFGVIDERMDAELLAGVAALRPQVQLVMIGPVVKIDPASLPAAPNIHWMGGRKYSELPRYIAGWDVAMLPFARNESTRYISPTKTPEYLAAGKPVVSTSIRDVVRPYGEERLAHIADDPAGFAAAIDAALAEDDAERVARADALLRRTSWDRTWARMRDLVLACVRAPSRRPVDATVSAAVSE